MSQIGFLVRIKDPSGARVAEFVGRGRRVDTPGGMQSFVYHKRQNTPGGFELRIDGSDERIALLDLDQAGTVDSQVEFWRRDPIGGALYNAWLATLPPDRLDASLPGWYKDFEAFYCSMTFEQNAEGKLIFVARGSGYNVLLAAEIIRYAAGSAYTNKSGAAETVAKEFVDENIGPSATNPPRDRVGVMPGLTIEADGGTGAVWTGARANKNLLDVCQELADFAPADYAIVGTGPATFEFQWKYPQWGLDRRLTNTAGNPPTLFGALYGNVENMIYTYSRLNEINTVDVLGVGKSATRTVVTTTSGTESDSPWRRRAVARDARDATDATTLTDRGNATLNQYRLRRVFTFNARQTNGCRYGRDWEVGDLVTLRSLRGMDVDQKIVGAFVSLGSDGTETITPECEEYIAP